jgi:hypothetical protein
MNDRLFCLVRNARGRLVVSARAQDIDQCPARELLASFDVAYAAARKLNAYEQSVRHSDTAIPALACH